MVAKFEKKNWLISLLFLISILFLALVRNSLAEDYISTADVVKEIEKTLLFDKGDRQELNVYKAKDAKKKSSLIINHGNQEKDYSSSEISIVVSDFKTGNDEVLEKEKLAYNAGLVGQYEVAIELYKQILKTDPNNNYAKFSLAVVYQKLSQNSQAKILYYDLMKSGADNKEEIIGNLLAILVDESPKDALYLLSRLTIENPKSSYILAQAALAYDKAKNYNKAIDLLKRAVTYDPEKIDYKYNLAVMYDKTSDYDNAYYFYSEVLKKANGENQSIPIEQIKKRVEFIRDK